MKIIVNNKEVNFTEELSLEAIAKELKIDAYAAKVNNRLRELTYTIKEDSNIEFLDLTSTDSMTIYQTTLRYVLTMALKNLNLSDIVIHHSISRSFYCSFIDETVINDELLNKINAEIKNIITAGYDIKRHTVSKEEAIKIYEKLNYTDKIDVIKYRPDNEVHFYKCNEYLNYMFGYMLPNTSYIKDFNLVPYYPGFILQYPRSDFGGKIPPFKDEVNFGAILKQSNKWGEMIGGNYINQMNQKIEDKKEVEFINLCESKHNMQLYNVGDAIAKDIENIRLIAIAGPSSSGKTTFTNRLKIELMIRGINPVMISIDDYYMPKTQAPKNEDGTPDLEHVNALDVDLFNKNMLSLIRGEEVELPHFNFLKGQREKGKKVKVDANTPILIEGIHALNDQLTSLIPNYQKFKIYIAPQAQLHIDNHNPISMTDIRLLRRMVRDNAYRNTNAEETMEMWKSVRNGEFKWIYPHQEKANFVFNSELTYELCVIKKYALKILNEVKSDSQYFIKANRLIKFLKYFNEIDDEFIPCNSLLREFIGGSSF